MGHRSPLILSQEFGCSQGGNPKTSSRHQQISRVPKESSNSQAAGTCRDLVLLVASSSGFSIKGRWRNCNGILWKLWHLPGDIVILWFGTFKHWIHVWRWRTWMPLNKEHHASWWDPLCLFLHENLWDLKEHNKTGSRRSAAHDFEGFPLWSYEQWI